MQIEFYMDKAGKWRWRAVASNNRIIADSAESYANLGDCEQGVVALRTLLTSPSTSTVEIGKDGGKSVGSLHALMAKLTSEVR